MIEKTLAQVEDIKNDSIIYFNTSGIYRYYPTYERIDLVLAYPFSRKVDAEIIDDLLYFTDNYSEPKKINLNRAQGYSNPYSAGTYYPKQIVGYNGNAYRALVQTDNLPTTADWEFLTDRTYEGPIEESSITLIKPPQREGTKATRIKIADNPTAYQLIGRTFQFAKRYIYRDGEKSVLSDYSNVLFDPDKEQVPDTYDDYNAIRVELGNSFISKDVKEIEILVRELEADFAWSVWKVITSMDYPGTSYTFMGNESLFAISESEAITPYHNVPLKVGCLASVDEGKRLGIANYEDGFDQVEVDATLRAYKVANYVDTDEFKYHLMGREDLWFPRYKGRLGIVYKDSGGRVSSVYTNEGLNLSLNRDIDDMTGIEWHINHRPPNWATHYSWVRTRDFSNSGYLHWPSYYLGSFTEEGGEKFDITWLNEYKIKHHIPFDIAVGDKMKLFGTSLTGIATVTVIDGNYMYVDKLYWEDQINGPDQGVMMEIWRPTTDDGDNSIFYEFGQTFLIDNGYHTGNILNQSNSSQAIGHFTQGNTYWVNRQPDEDQENYFVHCNTASKYDKAFGITEIGKPNVINKEAKKRRYPNHIKLSDTYFSDTQINGLSSFDFISKPLNEKYGEIIKMIEVGVNTLKVVQRGKCTSIYLGKEMIKSGPDNDLLATTDQTLGTVRTPEENLGSVFKDSVVKSNRNLYFFDIFAGAVVRDSPNGIFPISSYGMINHFKDLSKALLISGLQNIDIFATYDSKHDEFMLTFVDNINSANNQTWIFHEPSNSWTYELSVVPELWGTRGQFVVSFKEGEVWRHEANDIRGMFFGVKYPCSITPVFNTDPLKHKYYKAVCIEGNGDWASPEIGDIEIEQDETNKRGMKSRLAPGKFKWINGAQYAPYMRDMLSRSLTPSVTDLVNGRELRGKWLTQRLECWNDNEVIVAAITAEVQPIEISGGIK